MVESWPSGAKSDALSGLLFVSTPPCINVKPARLGGAGHSSNLPGSKVPIHRRNGKVEQVSDLLPIHLDYYWRTGIL